MRFQFEFKKTDCYNNNNKIPRGKQWNPELLQHITYNVQYSPNITVHSKKEESVIYNLEKTSQWKLTVGCPDDGSVRYFRAATMCSKN